jgi:hypothetical protein
MPKLLFMFLAGKHYLCSGITAKTFLSARTVEHGSTALRKLLQWLKRYTYMKRPISVASLREGERLSEGTQSQIHEREMVAGEVRRRYRAETRVEQ